VYTDRLHRAGAVMTRTLRLLLSLALLGGLVWLLGARSAFAVTYYLGNRAGQATAADGNTGNSPAAPWRTWGKVSLALEAGKTLGCPAVGRICPGDTVRIRPGRYAQCEGRWRYDHLEGGGTPGNPVTITIDTGTCTGGANADAACSVNADCASNVCATTTGSVEIHGGNQPGQCLGSTWQPARMCNVTGTLQRAICDADAHCGGAIGSCAVVPGVYWSNSESGGAWAGNSAGTAYQPNLNPVGGAPKLFEILYSPTAGNAPIRMPTWTAGRDQVWPYATWGAGQRVDRGGGNFTGYACRADKTPWFCCTGDGAGATCNDTVPPRIYVQTASGADPATVGDADFGPVEFPLTQFPLQFGSLGAATPARYITITNSGNGRTFYLWWGTRGIVTFENAEYVRLEDFDIAYAVRTFPYAHLENTDSANASGFPRYNAGDTYLVTGFYDQGAVNVVRNLTFLRGKIHASQGNEMFHLIGSSAARLDGFTDHLIESVEFCDGPHAPPNDASGTACSPNANTNQVTRSWPPPGQCIGGTADGVSCRTNTPCTGGGTCQHYESWAGVMNMGHWGVIGGGTNTDGAIISTARNQTFRLNYFHDTGLISFLESGGTSGLVFERNRVDMGRMYWTDAGYYPNVLTTYCSSPTGCGGLEGRLSLGLPMRFETTSGIGPVVRNNVFFNVYGKALFGFCFSNDALNTECGGLNAPLTPARITNNTFHVLGDYRAVPLKICGRPSGFGTIIWNGVDCTANAGLCSLPDTCQFRNAPQPVMSIYGKDSKLNYFPWATAGNKALIKNNLFFRETGSATGRTTLMEVDNDIAAVTEFDSNIWADPAAGANLTWRVETTDYATFAGWRSRLGGANELNSFTVHEGSPLFRGPYNDLSLDTTAPGISAAYRTGVDLTALGGGYDTDIEGTPRNNASCTSAGQPLACCTGPGRGCWSIGAYQGEATGSTVTTTSSTTTTSVGGTTTTTVGGTTTTTSTTSTTTPAVAGAPRNWTDDAATVAYWPFDNDYLNQSPATTWCNPVSNGDLRAGNNPSALVFSTDAVQGTHSINNTTSLGQIKDFELSGAADCLRSQSPTTWTFLSWWKRDGRATYGTACTGDGQCTAYPNQCDLTVGRCIYGFPQLVRNEDETFQNGWHIQLEEMTNKLVVCAGDGTNTSECNVGVTNYPNGFPSDGAWHMVTATYTGPGGNFAVGRDGVAQAVTGPSGVTFVRNNVIAGYPFEMPHAPGGYGGIRGKQDAVWWVDRVLTQEQVCRTYAVNADGSLGWCDGAAWATCTSDAQCGNRPNACNVGLGRCVGRLGQSGQTACDAVAELGPCNVDLDGNAPPPPPVTGDGTRLHSSRVASGRLR
jgi:hypothetical protein